MRGHGAHAVGLQFAIHIRGQFLILGAVTNAEQFGADLRAEAFALGHAVQGRAALTARPDVLVNGHQFARLQLSREEPLELFYIRAFHPLAHLRYCMTQPLPSPCQPTIFLRNCGLTCGPRRAKLMPVRPEPGAGFSPALPPEHEARPRVIRALLGIHTRNYQRNLRRISANNNTGGNNASKIPSLSPSLAALDADPGGVRGVFRVPRKHVVDSYRQPARRIAVLLGGQVHIFG